MQGLILGDSYKLIKEIPDDSIDCIVTDPPYEMAVMQNAGNFGVEKGLNFKQYGNIADGFNYSILDEFVRVLKKINIYIFCSRSQFLPLLKYFVDERGCNWTPILWHKDNVCPVCNNRYVSDTEYCLFFRDKGVKLYGNCKTKNTYYVTHMNTKDKRLYEHPTPKPLNLIKNLIFNSTKECDIVLDPFSGSGTTAVACELLKRRYIAIEIDEKFYKSSIERLEATTAQQPLF